MLKFILVNIFPLVGVLAMGAIGFWGVYQYEKQQPKEEK